MTTEGFIDALDAYLLKSRATQEDSDRSASRQHVIEELQELLDAQKSAIVSGVDDRVVQLIKGIKKNPLNRFLSTITPRMKIAWSAAAHKQIKPNQYQAFILNEEDRNFAEDLVARVEQLSHAFVRLCELSNEHFVISEEIRRGQPHPNAIDLSKVSPSLLKRDQDWRAEVEMITSFAHYELKSVVDMLKQWGVNVDKPELLYIAKTRDRFLSHPQSGGVMRKPRRSISIPYDGGPVEGSIAGLNSWGPISREQYLQFLNLAPPIDEEGERRTNEQLCLSHKRNEQFSEPEVVRLKAFGLREPNLTKALAELSDLLQTDALPKIDALYEQAVNVFGFERYN